MGTVSKSRFMRWKEADEMGEYCTMFSSSKKKIESNNNFNSILKRLRHEYFAVLGQFCAKSIIYCL